VTFPVEVDQDRGVVTVRTDCLEISVDLGGPADRPPVLLLHGWPDAPRGFCGLAHQLHAGGWRTVTPYLRGSGPTRFRSEGTPRVGTGVALAQDAIDLLDGLGIERCAVVGHDWGARAAYTLAALFPERVSCIAALALAYQPRGAFSMPDFEQARSFWYQWLMYVDAGADAVRRDPVGFARLQWETWSPPGWFDDQEFTATADSFGNPDWVAITLHAYRSRFLSSEATDPRYEALRLLLGRIDILSTPTLMIQGGADSCDRPDESAGLEGFFTGGYHRVVLDGVGHFPHREAVGAVSDLVLDHLREHGG
jgi:pimeloyl-ACP methyl ester carboxylesterase